MVAEEALEGCWEIFFLSSYQSSEAQFVFRVESYAFAAACWFSSLLSLAHDVCRVSVWLVVGKVPRWFLLFFVEVKVKATLIL